MATIYQRVKLFELRCNRKFGRKKYQNICKCINTLYKLRNPEETLPLVESIEGEKIFQARNFPDKFIPIIDGILFKFHAEYQPVPAPKEPAPPLKKIKKKTPVKKNPIYSTRNYK